MPTTPYEYLLTGAIACAASFLVILIPVLAHHMGREAGIRELTPLPTRAFYAPPFAVATTTSSPLPLVLEPTLAAPTCVVQIEEPTQVIFEDLPTQVAWNHLIQR